nr:hypothetical protein [Wolbachia endosymbiont (group B) of Episyrphus balteatus]
MSNLLNKYNTFYFIASSLATLTLLTSLALINVPSSLILALAVLSVLAFMILYKIIIDTRKVGKEFAHKERELTQEKHNLYEEGRKFCQKIEAERKYFLKEKKSLEEKLEAKMIHIIGITEELEKVTKEKDQLAAQEKELLHKISYLCKQLQEKEANLTERKKLIIELKRKIDNDKYEELYKEVEKLSKEKEELSKEIDKLRKEKHILYMKKEELHKRQEELCVELDELQCKFKEIDQKNKNLSQELKRKLEELDKTDGLIKNQSLELDRIRQDCNNEVKNLRNSLLERDSQIKQLQYVIDKIEESIRENETIKDYSKKIILGETQKIKFILGQLVQFTPGEDYRPLEEASMGDLGYESLPATPTKSPNSLLTESYELNQSEGIYKT